MTYTELNNQEGLHTQQDSNTQVNVVKVSTKYLQKSISQANIQKVYEELDRLAQLLQSGTMPEVDEQGEQYHVQLSMLELCKHLYERYETLVLEEEAQEAYGMEVYKQFIQSAEEPLQMGGALNTQNYKKLLNLITVLAYNIQTMKLHHLTEEQYWGEDITMESFIPTVSTVQ